MPSAPSSGKELAGRDGGQVDDVGVEPGAGADDVAEDRGVGTDARRSVAFSCFSLRDQQVEQVVDLARAPGRSAPGCPRRGRAARRRGPGVDQQPVDRPPCACAAPGRPGRCAPSASTMSSLRSASTLLTSARALEQRLDLLVAGGDGLREPRDALEAGVDLRAGGVDGVGDDVERLAAAASVSIRSVVVVRSPKTPTMSYADWVRLERDHVVLGELAGAGRASARGTSRRAG